MDFTPNVIHETNDYSQFKLLNGNRVINPQQVDQIIDVIGRGFDTNKYIIDVNEKGEIWDGQHRFTALKATNKPIRYKVTVGANISDCVNMNAHQHPWTFLDYIDSFANRGYQDYITLKDLINTFDFLPTTTILRLLARRNDNRRLSFASFMKHVKLGNFTVTDESLAYVLNELEYLKSFKLFRKMKKHGRDDTFYNALSLCYECEHINNERLYRQMDTHSERFGAFNTLEECLVRIQDIYNMHSHNKMFVVSEINRMLQENRKG